MVKSLLRRDCVQMPLGMGTALLLVVGVIGGLALVPAWQVILGLYGTLAGLYLLARLSA